MIGVSKSRGLKKLRHYCDEIEKYLFESDRDLKIECTTGLGCLYDCTINPNYNDISYNLYVKIYGCAFVAIQYWLNRSRSLEVSESELARIEDILADKAVSVLSIWGASPLIRQRIKKEKIKVYTFKESEDRSI